MVSNSFQPFVIYYEFNATRGSNVKSMLEQNNTLYFGTENGGLFMYDGKKITHVKGPSDDPMDQNVNGLFKSGENSIFVLTSSGLFSEYKDGKFSRISLGELKRCINAVLPDGEGGFWVSSCQGFFNISSTGKTTRILNLFSNRMFPVAKDSILVTT